MHTYVGNIKIRKYVQMCNYVHACMRVFIYIEREMLTCAAIINVWKPQKTKYRDEFACFKATTIDTTMSERS